MTSVGGERKDVGIARGTHPAIFLGELDMGAAKKKLEAAVYVTVHIVK